MSQSRKTTPASRVKYELLPGQSPELLETLHLLDPDGKLHADSRRKLKQVNHLVNLLTPALEDAFERHPDPVLVDGGAGNAYLGFVLYELFFAQRGRVIAVEPRADLVRQVRERAEALGYERLEVVQGELTEVELPGRVHLMVALHACDTATDDALRAGIEGDADHIAVVPCCQAEVARALKTQIVGDPAVALLWRHGIHRREFASHLTNVIRALVLEARGYQVTVTELTGWEHSLKNELILARRVHRYSEKAQRELDALLEKIPVRPKLLRELRGVVG